MTDTAKGQQPQQPAPAPAAPTVLEKSIADSVLNKIRVFEENQQINLPPNYSAANALKTAWLIILETEDRNKKLAVDVCTRESIANALLKMILLGLNPVKNQCAFVVYGNQLDCTVQYQGNIAMAKRDAGLKKVIGIAVFEKDEFAFEINPETGVKKVTKHVQTMDSVDSPVRGAYAVKTYEDGRVEAEVMTIAQIKKAWMQGASKGDSPAHRNFPDQMAIKTVINRALKIDLASSDDSAIMIEGEDDAPDTKSKAFQLKQEVNEHANKKEIGFQEPISVTTHQKAEPVAQPTAKPAAEGKAQEMFPENDEDKPSF